jgi:hypothetical protein
LPLTKLSKEHQQTLEEELLKLELIWDEIFCITFNIS